MRAKLALLGFFLFASQAFAEAKISDIKVALDGDRALATFMLEDAFDRRFTERVDSGLPTAILYRFELAHDRKRWWDQRLREATYEVVAVYDAVARAYTVHFKLNDKLIESRTVRDRASLQEAMTKVEKLPVFSVAGLPHEWRLLIKLEAELGSRTILSLIPATLSTDWKESPKFRAPGLP